MKVKAILRDGCAQLIAPVLRRLASDPNYFKLWQAHGFHVSQVHYYQPLPDTRLLPPSLWEGSSSMPGLDMRETQQLELLDVFTSSYKEEYDAFPRGQPSEKCRYFLGNVAFESVDAEILYCMIRHFKPRHLIEIGSGFSTLLAASAFAKNEGEGLFSRFTAIEPFPPPCLASQVPPQVKLVKEFVQNIPLSEFEALGKNDILFIDSSHVCKIGSDVQYEFLKILPCLRQGVLVHIHDIFLPAEYPRSWVLDGHRFWNEQYLLQAFLSFNDAYEILWAGHWLHLKHPDRLAKAFSSYTPDVSPASFWMRRIK
jgi:hypothetical protein